MIHGIDVSTWDGDPAHVRTLDWSAYSWDFTFIKVSEGLVQDPLFQRQWAAARGHTIRGAYHFFRPMTHAKSSVEKVLDYLGGDLGELPLALDLEVTDGMSDVAERSRDWLSWYEQYTGVRPIVYSSTSFLNQIGAARQPFFREYKLWLAQYPFDNMDFANRSLRIADVLRHVYPVQFPPPPAPFRGVTFWQWTALGQPKQVPGYYQGPDGKQEIDLNLYPATRQDLIREFEISELPDPNPDPGDEPMTNYVYEITPTTSSGCKVRSDHTTGSGNQVESLPYGRKAYGNEKWIAPVTDANHRAGDTWLRVLEVNGKVLATPAWVAEIHQGARVAKITQINQPPTDPPPTNPPATLPDLPVTITLGDDVTYTKQTITATLKPK